VPVVVVSPHLDDAVFSCGQLLAADPGSVVVTVFAGRPPRGRVGTWDQRSAESEDAVGIRRDEDRRALALLGATAVHLDFLDSQYRLDADEVTVADVAAALAVELARWTGPVYLPLGADHADHRLVSAAGMEVVADDRWVLYEELPYARRAHDWSAERRAGIGELVPAHPALGPRTAKAAAAAEYRSQREPMGKSWMLVFTDERYWRRHRGQVVGGGGGGNRTRVPQAVTVLATTIPVIAARRLPHCRVS
jgi:LmbE family N-acetylglucosaminyl deacetylase